LPRARKGRVPTRRPGCGGRPTAARRKKSPRPKTSRFIFPGLSLARPPAPSPGAIRYPCSVPRLGGFVVSSPRFVAALFPTRRPPLADRTDEPQCTYSCSRTGHPPRGGPGAPRGIFSTTASRMRHFGARFFDAVRGRGPPAPLFTAPAQAGSPRLREGGPIWTESDHSARGVDASRARFFDAVGGQGAPAPLFAALAQTDSPSSREVRPSRRIECSFLRCCRRPGCAGPVIYGTGAKRFAQFARGKAEKDGKRRFGTRRPRTPCLGTTCFHGPPDGEGGF